MRYRAFLVAAVISIAAVSAVSAQSTPCTDPGAIRSVTKARSGGYETVTFEINGRDLPQTVEIRNEKPPIEDYGGTNLHMKGKAFKSVNLRLVPWMCDIRENFRARTTTIKDVKQTEQFEGHVSYVIGYSPKSKYVGKSVVRSGNRTKLIIKFRR